MNGTTMNELYDYLKNGHEISFQFSGAEYSLESDGIILSLWKYKDDEGICIAKTEISEHTGFESALDALLSINCLEGKSFIEAERDITIDIIY